MKFFFSSRRRHTRFDCDWSSDVCSSDLFTVAASTAPFQRLADQALSVTKPAPGGGWPIGTGRYWMTSGDAASPAGLVAQPLGRAGQPVVQIATPPASAAPDALGGEAARARAHDP